jgi:hypothetical protein
MRGKSTGFVIWDQSDAGYAVNMKKLNRFIVNSSNFWIPVNLWFTWGVVIIAFLPASMVFLQIFAVRDKYFRLQGVSLDAIRT